MKHINDIKIDNIKEPQRIEVLLSVKILVHLN